MQRCSLLRIRRILSGLHRNDASGGMLQGHADARSRSTREDCANRQESIFKMIDGLFRGHLQPDDTCLNVVLHTGPHGIKGPFSRDISQFGCLPAHLGNDRRPSLMENLSLIRWSPSVPRQCPQHQETHSHSKCSTPCLYHNHQRQNTLTRVPEGARRNVLSPTSYVAAWWCVLLTNSQK